ncbi:hypothetical protein F4553_002921 [Allocatelliglobosispora scoriae]|uniref:Uncharacterized protein n=1 Tax=Allocatelliglobosispora scoriae TaxID=643052 RepID=A0A841BS38_9ACTN|nr:hypothetical protein [Allocatelliglobosispora scoriae]MBB5869542.1 hypothetical protein [Allocatelliglobosispora scoriae]
MRSDSGVEVMVKLGHLSEVRVDSIDRHGSLPIIEILVNSELTVMLTPYVGVEQNAPLTWDDLRVADDLARAATVYRDELARLLRDEKQTS